MSLCWTCSSLLMYWEHQNWTWYFRCAVISTEKRGRNTAHSWPSLQQGRRADLHCPNFFVCQDPQFFPVKLLSVQIVEVYCCMGYFIWNAGLYTWLLHFMTVCLPIEKLTKVFLRSSPSCQHPFQLPNGYKPWMTTFFPAVHSFITHLIKYLCKLYLTKLAIAYYERLCQKSW